PANGGWRAAVELQSRLVEPFLALAERGTSVSLSLETRRLDLKITGSWDSILAPAYVQIGAALERVAPGKRRAARRRRGQMPFLILDGRREAFCTSAEEHRIAERIRRQRRRAAVESSTRKA